MSTLAAPAVVFDSAVTVARILVDTKDRDGLKELGSMMARQCYRSNPNANVYALVLEYCREAYRFVGVGEDWYRTDELTTPLLIDEGTYTIAYPDSEETFTFRVRMVKTGRLAGKTVVDYLKGSDPTALDFETFAFVNEFSLNVFWKYERISGASGWLVNKAREIEKLVREGKDALDAAGFAYAQRSNRCRFCNHVLTDEASKAAGCGVTCAENHGIAHAGLVEKRSRKAPVSDSEETETEEMIGLPDDELDREYETLKPLFETGWTPPTIETEPTDAELVAAFPAAQYERWTGTDFLCESEGCPDDAIEGCQYCRKHALYMIRARKSDCGCAGDCDGSCQEAEDAMYERIITDNERTDNRGVNPDFYHMTDEDLESAIDSAERADARAEDAFENPTGDAAAVRAANAMIRELERRRATRETNMTELVWCKECGKVLVPAGEVCAACEVILQRQADLEDRYDAEHGI